MIRIASIFVSISILVATPKASAASLGIFLKRHCAKCHNAKTRKGKLNLSPVLKNAKQADIELVRRIREVVLNRDMPPEDAPQPSAAERNDVLDDLRKRLAKHDAALHKQSAFPGLANLVDHKTLFTEPKRRRRRGCGG